MNQINHSYLRERYTIRGELVMDTALHLGTGWQMAFTDKPILRDAAGRPLIPGASMKGAFRACVERLAPNVDVRSCALNKGNPICFTTHEAELVTDPVASDNDKTISERLSKGDSWRLLWEYIGRTVRLKEDTDRDVRCALSLLGKAKWIGRSSPISEDEVLTLLDEGLCDTCHLFGSPFSASKVAFDDLAVIEPWYNLVEVRDGVGIDRDSERAMSQIKYDFEAVPSQTRFQFSMMIDNPDEVDKGLIALGLSELRHGMLRLGGIRSRGLGKCHLAIGEEETNTPSGLWWFDPTDSELFLQHVRSQGQSPGMHYHHTAAGFDGWLGEKIEVLLADRRESTLLKRVRTLLMAWESDDVLRTQLQALLAEQ